VGVAQALAPDLAEAYNGPQGDMWDPHKDMAIALLGALVMAAVLWRARTTVEPRAEEKLGAL
jgi:putative membrane protein